MGAIGMLTVWILLPAPDRYLRNPNQKRLQRSVRESFPPYDGHTDLERVLLIADEECNTIFVVPADGQLRTLSTVIEAPETLAFDANHERVVISGRSTIVMYRLPLTDPPITIIQDWPDSVIECLISDEAGMLAGYLPDHLSRIHEDGSIEPLLSIPSPDSILPLGDNEYLIGTTQSQATGPSSCSLYRVNTATAQTEAVMTSEPVDNIEALVATSTGEVILGMGSLSGPGMARIATLDSAGNIATIVRVADVEGLAITLDGEIAFSNDELGTVFKISRRGGVYPFVQLFDPDDITPLQ
jgi:hypothetical protein